MYSEKEIGGAHYMQENGVQPLDAIDALKLNFYQGNILKYLVRFKKKNGLEDLKKAYHYCLLGDERKPFNEVKLTYYKREQDLDRELLKWSELFHIKFKTMNALAWQLFPSLCKYIDEIAMKEYKEHAY